jgi:hypothetical protein
VIFPADFNSNGVAAFVNRWLKYEFGRLEEQARVLTRNDSAKRLDCARIPALFFFAPQRPTKAAEYAALQNASQDSLLIFSCLFDLVRALTTRA